MSLGKLLPPGRGWRYSQVSLEDPGDPWGHQVRGHPRKENQERTIWDGEVEPGCPSRNGDTPRVSFPPFRIIPDYPREKKPNQEGRIFWCPLLTLGPSTPISPGSPTWPGSPLGRRERNSWNERGAKLIPPLWGCWGSIPAHPSLWHLRGVLAVKDPATKTKPRLVQIPQIPQNS